MMNAEHTLLAARPDSSRLNDDSRRCCSAAPTTSASTIAAPSERRHPDRRQAGDLLPAEPDRHDRAQRRAGGDAERVRRGQRVAKHRLKQRARQRQRAAGEQTEQRPRQAQLHEDRPVRFLTQRGRARDSSANGPTNGSTSAARDEHDRERADPARGMTRRSAHEYDTQAGPPAVVVSVRRDENSDSHSVDADGLLDRKRRGPRGRPRGRSGAWRTPAPG